MTRLSDADLSLTFLLESRRYIVCASKCMSHPKAYFQTKKESNIKSEYIESIYKLLKRDSLWLGNKLKMAHIQWRKQKIKVHLAAQFFSNVVVWQRI